MAVLLTILLSLSLVSCAPWPREKAVNPDPNHTHADFAIWVNGKKLSFASEAYMSTEDKHRHKYFHLHDGLGHVIHRHKPGLTLGEFFASIGFTLTADCMKTDAGQKVCTGSEGKLQMFVNGKEMPLDPAYVFADTDKILLTYGATLEQIGQQLKAMTNDACLYSRTCPERGEPPAENCIADPSVPCVAPLD